MLEEKSMNIASQLARVSNEIIMCLVNSNDPTRAILDRYDNAKDKHVFVAGLVGTLLLRHRQWQAAAEAKAPSICSAITPCQHVSNSNSAYPEDKSAKLGQSRMR